jgi:serine/threonine protein kinase
MALTSGTKLGPYEILSALGAGGMGEVYRARDTRLDRTVAIKVLPSHLSENPEARQRFDREARAISSLNHPNICTLHDVGQQDGVSFLVMEYLEGETLAERLNRGPLPIEQVLRYGAEICDGLERAHRSGVIHRDLKPGNIMLTKTGAKLMDFGLAKSAAGVTPVSSLTMTMSTPAGSHPLTAQGAVLGTFQYMAPEQVEGKEADARSDIFALGAVLYEMLTGKRAFGGKTAASAMAAVLEREPAPISSVQPLTPLALERLVKTCLAKDPDERWQTVHDVKLQLKQIAENGTQSGTQIAAPASGVTPHVIKKPTPIAWAIAGVLAVLGAFALVTAYVANQKQSPLLRAQLTPPDKTQFNLSGDYAGPATISPDGRLVVFSAGVANTSQLYLRALDSLTAKPLPGTEGGLFPFWSPDSRSIAFFTSEKLKRLDLESGSPINLCDVSLGRGGTWSPDGYIIAAISFTTGLSRVPATGGTPAEITKVDNVTYTSHRWPWLLPDGKHFLYIAVNHNTPTSPDTGIFYASVDGKENRLLVHTLASAVYASGYLLTMRDNALLAYAFDPARGKLLGDPQTLGEAVQYDASLWRANVSVSRNGMMVYASGEATGAQTLTWFDRSGKVLGTVGERGTYSEIQLSPDEKKLAVTDINTTAAAIWVYDLGNNLKSRLSFSGGVQRGPAWSPDGKRIAFESDQEGKISLATVGSSAGLQTLYSAPPGHGVHMVNDWSRDGRYILFDEGPGLNHGLSVLPLNGDRQPVRYPPNSEFGEFSPDGRWIAYASLEQGGAPIVFVAPYPPTGAKWQISSSTGAFPRWRGDGKEIYFFDFLGLSAVEVDGTGAEFRVGSAKQLFRVPQSGLDREYAVTRDGQRFLAIVNGEGQSRPLNLVQNWPAELKR